MRAVLFQPVDLDRKRRRDGRDLVHGLVDRDHVVVVGVAAGLLGGRFRCGEGLRRRGTRQGPFPTKLAENTAQVSIDDEEP